MVGQKVEVTLVPKYNVGNYKAVYNVEVNNAVNVYTNEDMKASFANTSVTEINILRKIEVALSDDQVIKFKVDGWEIVSPKNYSDIDSATGVYERRSGSLKINGNYFTVDGSKIPLIDARSGEEKLCVDPDGSTYRLLDTRFAIFLFGTRETLSNDVYSVDNLNVIGNGKMDAAAGYTMDGKTVIWYGCITSCTLCVADICAVHDSGGNCSPQVFRKHGKDRYGRNRYSACNGRFHLHACP